MIGTTYSSRARRARVSSPVHRVLNSRISLRGPATAPRRGSQHERCVAISLHLDDAGGVTEDRDLFPQNPLAYLQLQAPTVDRKPGDVVAIGSRIAEVLPVLEAHVKKVQICRSLADAAARPAELSQQHFHGSVFFHFIRSQVFARRTFSQCNWLLDPQVKYAQWLGRGVSALMPDDTSRFHPCEAGCGDFALPPGFILE